MSAKIRLLPRQKELMSPIEKLTGLSYPALLALWIILVLTFGLAYATLAIYAPEHGPAQVEHLSPTLKFWNSLYYSIITATSTGYGDITPQGFSKVLASMQTIFALMVFAISITKLVSQKQEMALQEVHRLAFEDVFHNTREGLYIIRKDFDRIIESAKTDGQLSEEDWMDLTVAYKQAESMLQEIPDFYANQDEDKPGIYTIDERREALLHEAVHRTLRRLNQMLDTLSRQNIDWVSHEPSMIELETLISVVDTVMKLWEKESPYAQAFEDILHVNQNIRSRMERMLPGLEGKKA